MVLLSACEINGLVFELLRFSLYPAVIVSEYFFFSDLMFYFSRAVMVLLIYIVFQFHICLSLRFGVSCLLFSYFHVFLLVEFFVYAESYCLFFCFFMMDIAFFLSCLGVLATYYVNINLFIWFLFS